MDCINYRWPLEHAETLPELEHTVRRLLKQYDISYFQDIYPDADWAELGEIVADECEADPEMPAVAYWLYVAEEQRQKLLETSRAGE